ncbi:MAG TPA: hypothetical protein VJW77_02495 [Terriglobia bacterium]|nr:hypothetical protein [Terriglobia bacterium]
MFLATAVLTLKIFAWHGLWFANIRTTRGATLQMLLDTGANVTLLRDVKPFEKDGLCVAIPNSKVTVCARRLVSAGKLYNAQKSTVAGFDGVLGSDFWNNFQSVTFDHQRNLLVATAANGD